MLQDITLYILIIFTINTLDHYIKVKIYLNNQIFLI